jgi:sulfate permease, SulP family
MNGPLARDSVPDEVSQPGLEELRDAVARARSRLQPESPRRDAIAGLSLAVANVPDGMANAVLVGVNPLFGLYATMLGPLVGGIVASTQLMVITTTAAASLTAGQALAGVPADRRGSAVFLIAVLAGGFQILFGATGLARLTRFVSYSVTTGFLLGISMLLIVSQVPTIAGYAASGSNKIVQAVDVAAHLSEINVAAVAVGALALVLASILPRTPLRSTGRLVAVAVPSALVAALGLHVQIVSNVGEIAGGIPTSSMPAFAHALNVLTGALSVAVVTLVQGVGVSQSVPNRDGSPSSLSRDFIAHGAANIASGLFRGLPVGGSLSGTAISVVSGARTRWSSIFAGLWMVAIVVLVPGLVSRVAMPALGALLVVAGASSVKPRDIQSVVSAGWPSALVGGITFVATLFLPIQAAVGLGVVLSALLFLGQSSAEVAVVELVKQPDGHIEERRPPRQLPSRAITVLDVYGDLYYAGARTLERQLPSAQGAQHPVVVLRLRGRQLLGATLMEVLATYAKALHAAQGRLYLTGMSQAAYAHVVRSGKIDLTGAARAHEATATVWQSTREAVADAEAFMSRATRGQG